MAVTVVGAASVVAVKLVTAVPAAPAVNVWSKLIPLSVRDDRVASVLMPSTLWLPWVPTSSCSSKAGRPESTPTTDWPAWRSKVGWSVLWLPIQMPSSSSSAACTV